MITQEAWYIEQTENILNGVLDGLSAQKREGYLRWKREWNALKPYEEKHFPLVEIEEEIEEVKVKEFAYSNINPYFSERIVKRIDRELKQIEINQRIAKENEKTHIFWLFKYLFGNENKDTVKKYKKEERERIKRVRKFKEREAKLTKDKTPVKHYDYTVSTDKLREDRNMGANHNTSKRTLKQIDVKALQLKAVKKTHKILRKLKEKGVNKNFLKSVTIYAGEVISESDPYQIIPILNEMQQDVFRIDQRDENLETETDKLKRYMCYSNKLENLRSYGISYKNLVRADKEKVKELRKEKDLII